MSETLITNAENKVLLWAFRAVSAALIGVLLYIWTTKTQELEKIDQGHENRISIIEKQIASMSTNIYIICQNQPTNSVRCKNDISDLKKITNLTMKENGPNF